MRDTPMQRAIDADEVLARSFHELAEIFARQRSTTFTQALQDLDAVFSPHMKYVIHEEP